MNRGGQPATSLFTRETLHRPDWVKYSYRVIDHGLRPHSVSEVNLWRGVLIQALDDATVEPTSWNRYKAIDVRSARDFFNNKRYNFHCDMALLEPVYIDRIYKECLNSSGVIDEFLSEIINKHSQTYTKGDNEDKLIRNN